MLERALARKGLAVLALLMPPVVRAQLPDAPSAVRARLNARSAPLPAADFAASANPRLHSAVNRAIPAIAVLRARASWSVDPSALPSATWQLALNMEPAGSGQQSLYKPGKEASAPGFSSSTADQRPVPGAGPVLQSGCPADTCRVSEDLLCCGKAPSPFARYLKNPDVVPLTARDNLRSAIKDIIDPFNLMTIGADSAIGVASSPHSPYGPGFRGFAKYTGVSLTEDMTGEFFGTFLVPSLMHQDPHYHREPFVSLKRRVLHAVTQVLWTQSTTGRPMLNYANILGGIATSVVSNTFVPGPGRQGFSATSQRLAIAFATSPSGNLVEEFVPDIASRINLHVVIFQRILNTVSIEEGGVQ